MTFNNVWRKNAACNGKPASWWFPPSILTGQDVLNTKEAIRICGACPVREQCLQAGLDPREQGIWGGKTVSQRRRLRQARYRSVAC